VLLIRYPWIQVINLPLLSYLHRGWLGVLRSRLFPNQREIAFLTQEKLKALVSCHQKQAQSRLIFAGLPTWLAGFRELVKNGAYDSFVTCTSCHEAFLMNVDKASIDYFLKYWKDEVDYDDFMKCRPCGGSIEKDELPEKT
jgi:hypothetical protein